MWSQLGWARDSNRPLYPLKPACSLRKLLKSPISLSMASRICIWRTSVYTASASEIVTVVSSYVPTAVWNLYLRISATTKLDCGNCLRVFCSVLYWKQIVAHRLVCKFVNKGCQSIHRSVGDKQRSSWPRLIRFLQMGVISGTRGGTRSHLRGMLGSVSCTRPKFPAPGKPEV